MTLDQRKSFVEHSCEQIYHDFVMFINQSSRNCLELSPFGRREKGRDLSLFPYSKNSKPEAACRRSATKLLHLGKHPLKEDCATVTVLRITSVVPTCKLFRHALICPQMHATRAGSLRRRATCRARLPCRLWAPGGYTPVMAITV